MKNCRADCECPHCSEEMARVLSMSPQQYADWLQQRSAASRRRSVTTIAPPDPYAPGVKQLRARLRAAQGLTDTPEDTILDALVNAEQFRRSFRELVATSRAAAAIPASSRIHREPPDPYAAGIARMREEAR